MSGERFEHNVATFLRKQGFKTEVTQQSNDRGIDVIAQRDGHTFAVQAKNYTQGNRVGSSAIQKASGLLSRPDIDGAIVITTSSFTSEAKAVANNRGVELLSTESQLSGRTRQRNKTRSSSVNKEFNTDPRVQHHQERANISPTNEEDKDSEKGLDSSTTCPNCGEEIHKTKELHVEHWSKCGLPDGRPSDIPVDIWWEIKDDIN